MMKMDMCFASSTLVFEINALLMRSFTITGNLLTHLIEIHDDKNFDMVSTPRFSALSLIGQKAKDEKDSSLSFHIFRCIEQGLMILNAAPAPTLPFMK